MAVLNPQRTYTYEVEGRDEFPLDMLRRDESAFHTEADRRVAVTRHTTHKRRVKLSSSYAAGPLVPRWESFGWRVVACSLPHVMLSGGQAPETPRTTEERLAEAVRLLQRFIGEADSVTLAHGGVPERSDRWSVTGEARAFVRRQQGAG